MPSCSDSSSARQCSSAYGEDSWDSEHWPRLACVLRLQSVTAFAKRRSVPSSSLSSSSHTPPSKSRRQRSRSGALVAAVAAVQLLAPTAAAETTPASARADAVTWLLEHQNPTGSWGASSRREVLVTALVLRSLRDANVEAPQLGRAQAWLATASPTSTTDLAAVLRALHDTPLSETTQRLGGILGGRQRVHETSAGTLPDSRCVGGDFAPRPCTGTTSDGTSRKQACVDGGGQCVGSWWAAVALLPHAESVGSSEAGWGDDAEHRSAVPATAVALQALREASHTSVSSADQISEAVDQILEAQVNAGPELGGFVLAILPQLEALPNWPQSPFAENPDIATTARAIRALQSVRALRSDVASAIADGVAWLRAAQKSDGGWGDGELSTVEETALVYTALRAAGVVATDPALDTALTGFLLPAQNRAGDLRGSWSGDPYATALAIEAVNRSGLATDTDGDGILDINDPDDDGDGTCDPGESDPSCTGSDVFPLDPSETSDLDGDGLGDSVDRDRDGDGFCDPHQTGPGCTGTDAFPDNAIAHTDSDGDSIPDASDRDIDGDGALNTADAFPLDPNESRDTDGDGVGDNEDADDDNDGIRDEFDPCPLIPGDCMGAVHAVVQVLLEPKMNPGAQAAVAIVTAHLLAPECDDGLDNDGDGLVDIEDGGCSNAADPSETGGGGEGGRCGLGAELVLLASLFRAVGRRRRSNQFS